jgi:DNA-binding LytR/AlgR family response regulator
VQLTPADGRLTAKFYANQQKGRPVIDPDFRPRSHAFFFLRVGCHYHAIPLDSLLWVRVRDHLLIVQTDTEQYKVSGTLDQLQNRLPVCFARAGRGLLIANFSDL